MNKATFLPENAKKLFKKNSVNGNKNFYLDFQKFLDLYCVSVLNFKKIIDWCWYISTIIIDK